MTGLADFKLLEKVLSITKDLAELKASKTKNVMIQY